MIIDVTKSRKQFFQRDSPARVLRQAGIDPAAFSNLNEIQDYINQGRLVLATTEKNAHVLAPKNQYRASVTQDSLVETARNLKAGQVMVLPQNFYVKGNEAGFLRNYQDKAFESLDQVAVGRRVTGDKQFSYWTDELRIKHQAYPDKLFFALLDELHEQERDPINNSLMGYKSGKNLFEWAPLYTGSVMRVWQNKWGYFKGINRLKDKLTAGGLTNSERTDVKQRIRSYEKEIVRYGVDKERELLEKADRYCLDDVIEVDGKPGMRTVHYGHQPLRVAGHWRMNVFRRNNPDTRRVYHYHGVPAVPNGMQQVTAALVHKIRVNGDTEHEHYANLADRGHPFTGEAVAGLHGIDRIIERSNGIKTYDYDEPDKRYRVRKRQLFMPDVPAAIPTNEGFDFAEVIDHQTVFIKYDPEQVERGSKTPWVSYVANDATFSKAFGVKVLADGSDAVAMRKSQLYERGDDPMSRAIRFRGVKE